MDGMGNVSPDFMLMRLYQLPRVFGLMLRGFLANSMEETPTNPVDGKNPV